MYLAIWLNRCLFFNYPELAKVLIDHAYRDYAHDFQHYPSKICVREGFDVFDEPFHAYWVGESSSGQIFPLALLLSFLKPNYDLSLLAYMLNKGELLI